MTVEDLDVVRLTAEMLNQGIDDVQNVYHVLKVDGGSMTDADFMDDMADQLDLMYAFLTPRQITTHTYEQITGQKVFGGDDLMPDTAWPARIAGVQTADALPPQVAAMVAGQTVVSKVQGRKYLGGFTEIDNVNGVLESILVTALTNFALNWIGDFIFGAHTYRFGVWNKLTSVFTPLVSDLVLGTFRTQRRRTIGFGS